MMRLRLAGGGADWVGAEGPAALGGVVGPGVAGVGGFLRRPGGDAVRAGVAGNQLVHVLRVVRVAGVVRPGVVRVADIRASAGFGSVGLGVVGRPVGRRLGRGPVGEPGPGLEQVEGVAALQELGHHPGPDRRQRPVGVAIVSDPDRERVDVGLARDRGHWVELAAGQGRVAGVLAAQLDPLPGQPRVLFAGLDAVGVELHLQRGGLADKLVIAQAGGGGGEDLVGAGGVGVGQARGPGGDRVGAVAADAPGGHAGQRPGEAGGQGGVALEAGIGVVRGDEQLGGELVGGELARAAAGPDPARLRVPERCGPAAAELRDRQRLQVGRPVLQPPGRVQRPSQLIIGQSPRGRRPPARSGRPAPGRGAARRRPGPGRRRG